MKRKLFMFLILLLLPFMAFAGDISAVSTGSTKEEAERNAYIELSKFINISVYDEEKLESYSDDESNSQSKYSSQAIHTTANNFIKTEKQFDTQDGIITCKVTLLESSAPNYITLMEDYVKTINSLEQSYEEKSSKLSFEIKKITITNILEAYKKYDNAKSILLALDKFNSDIVKPNKTSSIWNNEYQNIIIIHNNELLKKISVLDSNSSDSVIQNQINSINTEIAQSRYELQQAIIERKNSTSQLIEQRQKEIDSRIDEIVGGIIKDNAVSAEVLSNSIDIKQLLNNFNNYYNQYQSILEQYSMMLENQKEINANEIKSGVEDIENREYQLSDLNSLGNPGYVVRKIRATEIETFKADKKRELENNLKIINDKFTPMLNELQSSMLSILSSINGNKDFSLTVNPSEIDCELDVDDACFYCTIGKNVEYLPIDGVKIKIPLSSLDKKMDFNINNRQFDVNNKNQVAAYNDYTDTIEIYKKLMKEESFLSYRFKLKINVSTVSNRFSSGNKYNAKIVTEIEDLQVLRNDLSNSVVANTRIVYGNSSRISKQYEDFFDADIPFLDEYYSSNALAFYNSNFKTTKYTPRSSSPVSSSRDINATFNELGDPLNANYSLEQDAYKAFFSVGFGATFINEDLQEKLVTYYAKQGEGFNLNLLSQMNLNLSYFNVSASSLYINVSYIYRFLNYKAPSKTSYSSYSQSMVGAKLGLNLVVWHNNRFYVSLIPYVGTVINTNESSICAGTLLTINTSDSGVFSIGCDYILSGDLEKQYLVYLEAGF